MTLTVGGGPFGHRPLGRFNFDPPEQVVYVEPFPRRVRAVKDGVTVLDSDRVMLVHATRSLPYFAFPADDVEVGGQSDPRVDDHVVVPWDSVDAWFEEEDEVFVHPRDPYHRIDTFSTSRRIRVSLDGVVLADTRGARGLYETGLPVRWYIPRADVRMDLLEPSETVTGCAYKGRATHLSARTAGAVVPDVAWTYEGDVQREAEEVRGRICFYDERTDVEVDGVTGPRPQTAWSR